MAHLRLFQAVYGLADDWRWWRSEEGFALGKNGAFAGQCTEDEAHHSIRNHLRLEACRDETANVFNFPWYNLQCVETQPFDFVVCKKELPHWIAKHFDM